MYETFKFRIPILYFRLNYCSFFFKMILPHLISVHSLIAVTIDLVQYFGLAFPIADRDTGHNRTHICSHTGKNGEICKKERKNLKAHLISKDHGLTEAEAASAMTMRNVMYTFIERGCNPTDLPGAQNGFPLFDILNPHFNHLISYCSCCFTQFTGMFDM